MFSIDSKGPIILETVVPITQRGENVAIERQNQRIMYFTVLGMAGVSLLLGYFIIRNLALFNPGYKPLDRVASIFLLLSEIYVSIQGVGYYFQVLGSLRINNVARTTQLAKLIQPSVAIYIATYNEPGEVVEETVNAVSLMQYSNMEIYVNCDHQSSEQATIVEEITRRHHVHFIHRTPNTGFKAGGINEFLNRLGKDLPDAEYLCVFDADSIPALNFLQDVMPYFENDMRISYVQVPQFYGNSEESLVADASAHQQSTFAQYISEGKQSHEAMFYTGTNVIFRVAALRDIDGLLTNSITEDFNTSIQLHRRGWKSQYCNSAYVVGMGPTSLQAYWTQQGRWALGNMESFLQSIPDIFWRPGLSPWQRWEYFLSGTYFFVGLNTLVELLLPAMFLLFGIRPLIISPLAYIIAYVPHFLVSNIFFFTTMNNRGYQSRILFLAQSLTRVSFPVFVSAAIAALMHRKKPFAVTPKGGVDDLMPLSDFWPQITMIVFLTSAVFVGMLRIILVQDLSIIVNIAWCLYHAGILYTFVLFRQTRMSMSDVQFASRFQI